MWLQFFGQDGHFAISLFASLVCAAVCWLYLDAWLNKKAKKELFKWLGFGLLALSYLLQATVIEQAVLGKSIFGNGSADLFVLLRILGYGGIIFGLVSDPLMKVPDSKGLSLDEQKPGENPEIKPNFAVTGGAFVALKWLMPFGGLAIAGLYWRRATTGLERHYKSMAYGFLLLALSDFIHLADQFRDTTNPTLYGWVAAFGWVWFVEQFVLLIGAIIIGRWIWGYLTQRFFSQLFMILSVTTVVIFLVVSVAFTGLLLREIRTNALTNLATASQVLGYALQANQSETLSGAEQVSSSNDIVAAVATADRDKLISLTKTYLTDKHQTGLVITDQNGKVLLRAEDTAKWGDSLSDDPLIRRALIGQKTSSVTAKQGVTAPTLQVRSVTVIRASNGSIAGTVLSSLELGPAFVDGIRKTTGLQSSIYAGDTLAATSNVSTDGKTRAVGSKLSDKAVKSSVLDQGKPFQGSIQVQNRRMLGAFLPLKDADNDVVGMLLVAQPESSTLRTAGRSIEITFLFTAALLLVSTLPIYWVTKKLVKQLD